MHTPAGVTAVLRGPNPGGLTKQRQVGHPPQNEHRYQAFCGPVWLQTFKCACCFVFVLFFKWRKCFVRETAIEYWTSHILFLLCPSDPHKSLKLQMPFSCYALFHKAHCLGAQRLDVFFACQGGLGCLWFNSKRTT